MYVNTISSSMKINFDNRINSYLSYLGTNISSIVGSAVDPRLYTSYTYKYNCDSILVYSFLRRFSLILYIRPIYVLI